MEARVRHYAGTILSATLTVIAAMVPAAVAQQPAQPKAEQAPKTDQAKTGKPGAVVAEVTQITAKVDAVDYDKRLVTLTGPKGNTVTVKAGPEVKNLDQVKPGDQLIVRHYQSVALSVRKPGDPPAAGEATAVQVASRGQKPAGVMVDTKEVTATVEAIDYGKRTVTLKGPEGKTITVKVDPSVKRLNEVKKGDEVVARVTEALAIAVRKPAASADKPAGAEKPATK
jgi:hypothetical protein